MLEGLQAAPLPGAPGQPPAPLRDSSAGAGGDACSSAPHAAATGPAARAAWARRLRLVQEGLVLLRALLMDPVLGMGTLPFTSSCCGSSQFLGKLAHVPLDGSPGNSITSLEMCHRPPCSCTGFSQTAWQHEPWAPADVPPPRFAAGLSASRCGADPACCVFDLRECRSPEISAGGATTADLAASPTAAQPVEFISCTSI